MASNHEFPFLSPSSNSDWKSPAALSSIMYYDMFGDKLPPHSSHPNFFHLTVLVLQAVMEVVIMALPGYILASNGWFNATQQKFLAEMNVSLFTPCLIFYKLSSKLRRNDLPGLVVIPAIFIVQTVVSYLSGRFMSWSFGFKKKAQNFVVAMAVFGNSNSLPISLVTALSFTIKGLHWAKEPHDNDSSVATRGLTYLVLFQQLGQIIRWTWGFKVLLRTTSEYKPEELEEHERTEQVNDLMENGERQPLLVNCSSDSVDNSADVSPVTGMSSQTLGNVSESASAYASSVSTCSCDSCEAGLSHSLDDAEILPADSNGNYAINHHGQLLNRRQSHKHVHLDEPAPAEVLHGEILPTRSKAWWARGLDGLWTPVQRVFKRAQRFASTRYRSATDRVWASLPSPVQKNLSAFNAFVMNMLSPPLISLILAFVLVLCPPIKDFFYETEFMKTSFISAVRQGGDVAVPLIIVCLGGNLARNTLPDDQQRSKDPTFDRKLVFASLMARMFLPLVIMAPLLTLTAIYLPVNILGDPIFIIVCYLLVGAPTALQLSQLSQLNDVYQVPMIKILQWSYVVIILPSTLILVMLALETLEWAQAVNS